MPREHRATQQGDEMFCPDCGCRWDVNDPKVPVCTAFGPFTHPDLDDPEGPEPPFQVRITEALTLHGITLRPGVYQVVRLGDD